MSLTRTLAALTIACLSSSWLPARAVLELNGGTAARLKIQVGDRVMYRTFGTAE